MTLGPCSHVRSSQPCHMWGLQHPPHVPSGNVGKAQACMQLCKQMLCLTTLY